MKRVWMITGLYFLAILCFLPLAGLMPHLGIRGTPARVFSFVAGFLAGRTLMVLVEGSKAQVGTPARARAKRIVRVVLPIVVVVMSFVPFVLLAMVLGLTGLSTVVFVISGNLLCLLLLFAMSPKKRGSESQWE